MKAYNVNAIVCDHRYHEDQDKVYDALCRVTNSLDASWDKLEKAGKIVIKFNAVWPPDEIQIYEGVYRELVDPSMMNAVLRLLRERTKAEITVLDTSLTGTESDVYFKPLLEKYNIRFVNGSNPPIQWYDVPGGGLMFNRYLLSSHFADADAVVSVTKFKSHKYTGITLSTKNLFGCSPLPPNGRPRQYFHHPVRLPYCMADLGRILNPCLNIVEGMVGQTGQEWGGEGRVTDVLIAGDQTTATDACGAYLMGHDPASDWPTPPFKRERNYILLAASKGFGTVDLSQINFNSEVKPFTGYFDSNNTDPAELLKSWRKTASEQGLYYLEHRKELVEKYAGEYIFLQKGKVVWHGLDTSSLKSRRILSGEDKGEALWMKYVDPDDMEEENFEVYRRELEEMAKME